MALQRTGERVRRHKRRKMPDQIGVARCPEDAAQLRRWCPYISFAKSTGGRKEETKDGWGGFDRRVTVEAATILLR